MPFPSMNPALARALAERGYAEPTPVQNAVLQPQASGRDLLVSAQTGSGKTVAFGVALAETLLGCEETFGSAGLPLALIIAPTRELALQVQRELEWLYAATGARIASCVGGMDIRREARTLASGCHIVVGTPGRLKDHIQRKRLELSQLRAVVLDEADEMLDLGFREDLEYILGETPAERRTLLFSATIAHEIATLARTYQRDAVRIETINRNEAHRDIEYRAIRVAGAEIERAVVNILRYYDSGATLVFCSTREAVKRLHGSLLERGFAAVALSGELSQAERTSALQSLRDGRSRVCVATDVAARGLDLPDLGLVIHADLPHDRETLLHRSGRTGRAGRKGLCILMVPPFKRRRAEMLLRSANVNATWAAAPTADEVRAKDQERMLNDPMFAEEMTDEDLVIALGMLAKHTPQDVALALVRVLRARLPAPEDVSDPGNNTFKDRRPHERGFDRDGRAGKPFDKRFLGSRDGARGDGDRPAEGGASPAERGPPRERLKAEDTVWFRINIGRNRNADPRWLIPLICKAGGITKAEIGSIRIFDVDTRFQIAKAKAEGFAEAVKGKTENNTTIAPAFGADSHANEPNSATEGAPRPFKKGPFKHKGKPFGAARGNDPTPFADARPTSDSERSAKPFKKGPFKKRPHATDGFKKERAKSDGFGNDGFKPERFKPEGYKKRGFKDGGWKSREHGADIGRSGIEAGLQAQPASGPVPKPYKTKKKFKTQ